MQFYSGIIAPLIIEALRYYFSNYTNSANLVWHPDEKLRTIDIAESFDLNRTALQQNPRILVTRGTYMITKVGLTDNLAEGKSLSQTSGLKDSINMQMYQGAATVTIETRNKGTCELISDMVSHFITWTRPVLCDAHGWKEFGLPLAVSDIGIATDENPGIVRFVCNISVPWMKEEHWRSHNDAFRLKAILSEVKPQ